MAVDEQYEQTLRENRELQERVYFLLDACSDAQDMASYYGWALKAIADLDPTKQRADDLGRAARIARDALRGPDGAPEPRKPDGYAYDYDSPFGGIRFNNGEPVNGSKPTRAIPYWLGAPPNGVKTGGGTDG